MLRSSWKTWFALLGLMLLVVARPASAQNHGGPPSIGEQRPVAAGQTPEELEGIGIEDKNGSKLPRDLKLTGSDGRSFVLGEFMDDERPLVLVLAYYGCPMLCSMVLNGTVTALKGMNETAGGDYRLLVVSFDPRDTVQLAHDKRENYLASYGREVQAIGGRSEPAFEFAIADEAEVKRLADTIGFRYRWDEAQQQYAHAAGIFIVTPGAVLSTTLTGVEWKPEELSGALADADKGAWHSPLKSVLFYCFQFNPHTGKYTFLAGRIMRIGAGVTLLAVLFLMYRLFRADRRNSSKSKASRNEASQKKTAAIPQTGQT